jgi:hypothetical protein
MEEREKKSLKFLGNCRKGFPFSVRIATKAGSPFFSIKFSEAKCFYHFLFLLNIFFKSKRISRNARNLDVAIATRRALFIIFSLFICFTIFFFSFFLESCRTHNVHRRGLLNKEKSVLDGRETVVVVVVGGSRGGK